MTFRRFILTAEVTDDPRGDFIQDARREIEAGRFWDRGKELVGINSILDRVVRETGLEVYHEWRSSRAWNVPSRTSQD